MPDRQRLVRRRSRPALAPASLGADTENKSLETLGDEIAPARRNGGQVSSIATVLDLPTNSL